MNDQITQIIISYLKGEASPEEVQKLKLWLVEDSSNKKQFDQICDIWVSSSAGMREKLAFNASEALLKVNSKITQNEEALSKPTGVYFTSFQVFWRVAASIIITLGISYFVFGFMRTGKENGTDNLITEITAPIGSKSKITLPDGSKIWLNAGSTLRYNGTFNKNNREVKLEGEAYFDVTKKVTMPFIVHTLSNIHIRVLGTAFNLKAYPREGSVETTLVRGALIVEHDKGKEKIETSLAPNQRATFIKNEGVVFLSEVEKQVISNEVHKKIDQLKGQVLFAPKVETDIFTSWKDNKLVFRNEGFESLAIKLERWYGVKINFNNDEIKNYHFNGTIENETINDVFNIISYTLPIKYNIHHNVVNVEKK